MLSTTTTERFLSRQVSMIRIRHPGRLHSAALLAASLLLGTSGVAQAQDATGASGPVTTEQSPAPISSREKTEIKLSLGEAIRTALANNYDIKIASINRSIQTRQEIIEKALFIPDLVAGYKLDKGRRPSASVLEIGNPALQDVEVNPVEDRSYNVGLRGRSDYGANYAIRLRQSRLDQPRTRDAGIIGLNPQNNVSVAIELTQPLLRGVGQDYNLAGVRLAANNKEISVHELKRTIANLVYQLEVAYWQLSFSWKNFEAKTKSREGALQNFENVKAARDEKRRSDLDVITAESQLSLRNVELSEARSLLEDSRDTVLLIINFPRDFEIRKGRQFAFHNVEVDPISEPEMSSLFSSKDIDSIRTEALNSALDLRPEYQQVNIELLNKEIEADVAFHQRLPSLNLVSSWEQLGLDETHGNGYSGLGTFDFYAFTVGVEFEFGAFSQLGRELHYQALDEVRQINFKKAQVSDQIVLEVDQSIRNLLSLHSRVRDLQKRVELQGAILDKEREKLELGRTTYYNVTVIENDLIASQALSLRSVAEYQAAKSHYYLVTGRLLMERGVSSTVVDSLPR